MSAQTWHGCLWFYSQPGAFGELAVRIAFSSLLAAVATGLATTASALPVELITNGGFEAGLAAWTVTDQAGGSGSWFADDADGFTPFSGQPTVGPAAGAAYAVTDQTGPGAHALTQAFFVPIGTTSVSLSFDMFVNDWDGGPIVDPAGLDYTAYPNQHARVDILLAGSPALSTSPFDVLGTFYLGVDGFSPNPYTPYGFDVTGLVAPGGTYELRFAEVDNQGFFNQGVDNVSVLANVPEPATLAMLVAASLAIGAWRRMRRHV